LLQYWEQTGHTLLDTDDAIRLTQMRAWFAGHGVDPEAAERSMRAFWASTLAVADHGRHSGDRLADRLQGGTVPDWLKPVTGMQPFLVTGLRS